MSYVGGNSQAITIEYAPGKFINWDGTGIDGVLVAGGVYEVKIEQQFDNGYKTMSAKSITVLTARTMEIITDLRAVPNPVYSGNGSGERVELTWSSPYSGRVEFKIYNTAGELVSKFRSDLASASARWEMKSAGGNDVASGVYVIVAEAITDKGERQRLFIKSVVVKKGSSQY